MSVPNDQDVGQQAIRGVPWTALTFATNKIVTISTTVVLARLLDPSSFGIVAIATLVVYILATFNDFGLSAVMVLRPDLDDREKGTVLTVTLATSVVLTAVLAASAPLIAALFHQPKLTAVLLVMAVTVLLGGPAWFYQMVIQRELQFARRFATRAVETLSFSITALTLAVLGAGVWSLVWGEVARVLGYTIALLVLSPYRIRPRFNPRSARELFVLGRGFLVQATVAFLQWNADYMTVGRVLGSANLGVYSMAYRLSELPFAGIADPVVQVTFPAFARLRNAGADLRSRYISTLRVVALLACPLGTLLSATAQPFTETLFGPKWLPMITPLAILGVWGVIRPVEGTVGWFLNSIGEASVNGRLSGVALVLLVPALIAGALLGGLAAVAWVMLGHMLLLLTILSIAVARQLGLRLRDQAIALMPVAAACVVSWLVARGVVELLAGIPSIALLAVGSLAGIVAYVTSMWLLGPWVLREAREYAMRSMGRASAGSPATASEGRSPDRTLRSTGVRNRFRTFFRVLYRTIESSPAGPLLEKDWVQRLRWRFAVKMSGTEVLAVIEALESAGVSAWLFGGWGVDALIGRQTRKHPDIDIVIDQKDERQALDALARCGFSHCTRAGDPRLWVPVRLMLRDDNWRLVDLHPLDIAAFEKEHRRALAEQAGPDLQEPLEPFAVGMIAGRRVGCISREMQVAVRQGYRHRPIDRHDLALLD